jgi:hypothetical protein
MKSSKVRMEINRNHHEWFKSQAGKTNNERMHYIRHKIEYNKQTRSSMIYWHNKADKLKREKSALKKMLTLSVVISWSAAICLGYLQGWFV